MLDLYTNFPEMNLPAVIDVTTSKVSNLTYSFMLLLILSKCVPVPQIEDFDSPGWILDRNGCQGVRTVMEEILWANREKLMNIPEARVIELLGKPNLTELYVGNQKFFVYYMEASADCENGSISPHSLLIRFDALNYCSEISVKD